MRTITLTIPSLSRPSFVYSLQRNFKDFQTRISTYVHSFTDYADAGADQASTSDTGLETSPRRRNFKLPVNLENFMKENRKNLKFVPIAVIALVLMVSVGMFLRNSGKAVLGNKDTDKISVEKPLASQVINKDFSFPVLDSAGEEAGKLQYTVETAELRDQLIIKGQQARAIEGRTFLIISLKITNDTQHTISVNTRDFIRLKKEGSEELVAPTIHNDPVEAQAISTLTTRVGFSVPDNDTEGMSLQIGEIAKDKQTVELDLK